MKGTVRQTPEPRAAKHVSIRLCSHGTVYVDLLGADGRCFATAPLNASVALDMARQIMDGLEEGAGLGPCEGHA